jgi:hypothetical protein
MVALLAAEIKDILLDVIITFHFSEHQGDDKNYCRNTQLKFFWKYLNSSDQTMLKIWRWLRWRELVAVNSLYLTSDERLLSSTKRSRKYWLVTTTQRQVHAVHALLHPIWPLIQPKRKPVADINSLGYISIATKVPIMKTTNILT